VVIFQRFLRHMGRKRVIGIRKIGKREGHGVMSENDGRRGLTGTLIEGSIGLKHRKLANAGPSGSRPDCHGIHAFGARPAKIRLPRVEIGNLAAVQRVSKETRYAQK
jgi:hypothetical protein